MPTKKYVDCKKRSVAAVMTAALVTGYPENSLLEMRMKKNLKDTAADFCEENVSLFISLAILQLGGALWYHAMSTFNCLSLGQHKFKLGSKTCRRQDTETELLFTSVHFNLEILAPNQTCWNFAGKNNMIPCFGMTPRQGC